MDNRLSSVFVPASPSERAELCLPRSGAPAPAGDRRDDDDNARTTHSSYTGVPGVSGTSVLANLQIPPDWGTQETPELDRNCGLFTWSPDLFSHVHGENSPVGPLNSRQIENSVGETSGNLLRETSGNVVGETFGGTYGEKIPRRIDHVATWHRTRAKKSVSSTQESSGGTPLAVPEVSNAAVSSPSSAGIGIDDPSLDNPRPEELPFIKRLNIWQARDSGHYEPAGASASTEYFRMTPRGEGDDDPLIVDGDAPRMRWMELQRRYPILPRRTNLDDFENVEDYSDDHELTEEPDRSDSRYVRSHGGGAPPAKGRGRHEKGRGKGLRRAPQWSPPITQPPSSTGWFPTWETSRNQHRDLESAYAISVRMAGRS